MIETLNIKEGLIHLTKDLESRVTAGLSINLKEIVTLGDNKEYTPKKGDKIFIDSACNIPRFKVKNFCLKYGVALVKKQQDAHITFVPNNHYKQFLIQPRILMRKQDILNFLYKGTRHDSIRAIQNSEHAFVYADWNERLRDLDLEEEDSTGACSTIFQTPEHYAAFKYYINNPNVYKESALLNLINADIIIGAVQYDTLDRLFESTDVENTKVAMETMANSDYQKGCVYLLLLVHKHYTKMYESPTRNHVNFKSFLNYFKINQIRSHMSINNIVDRLIELKLLSYYNMQLLSPYLKEEFLNSARCNHIVINELEFSEEIENAFDECVLNEINNTEIIPD